MNNALSQKYLPSDRGRTTANIWKSTNEREFEPFHFSYPHENEVYIRLKKKKVRGRKENKVHLKKQLHCIH